MRRALWSVLAAIVGLALLVGPAGANNGSGPIAGVAATLSGTISAEHGDDFAHGRETDKHYFLDTSSGSVALDLAPGDPEPQVGALGHARGTLHGSVLTVPAGGLTTTAPSTTATALSGTKTVAVLMFNFSNDTSTPWTSAYTQGVVFDNTNSVAQFYQQSSGGALTVTGAVFGWYTIPNTNGPTCDWSGWATAARNAATSAGVNLSSYQYLVYAFPRTSACGWAGLGYLPGSGAWTNGEMTLRVVGHELGHNFGVHHASADSCVDGGGVRVTLSTSCTASEYGDPFSIMGSGATRFHHAWHKAQLGWLSDTQTITTSGTYTVAPVQGTGTPRLLRILRANGTYFQIDYRQPTTTFDNYSPTAAIVNGVAIRIAPNTTTITQSHLLDTTPATTTFDDAPLTVGHTFTDPATGMQITTVSVSATGATVSIQFAPDSQAPTAPTNLAATAKTSSSIGLAWTASTDNVGVTGYRVYRNSVLVASPATTTFTDTGLTPGTGYSYQVTAIDAANNESALSNTATATTPTTDSQAPTAPSNLRASASKSRTVSLSWLASTDNVGVTGYRLYRNGVFVKTITTTSTSDKPGRGSFSYQVSAVDAMGNESGKSNIASLVV
jgi:chitodextrinase